MANTLLSRLGNGGALWIG